MEITIDHLTAGAARARGVAVIIDVFRAYSVECYAYHAGAERIYPVGDLDEAYARKRAHPEYLLAGERHAKAGEGFDFGNSPMQVEHADLRGKRIIHTTSAGTQGIAAAKNADTILLAALVNARATAEYLRRLAPERVSFVCMGFENLRPTLEDTVCAEYMRAMLLGEAYDLQARIPELREGPGARFFVPEAQSFAPERDFYLCTQADIFPFALHLTPDEDGVPYSRRVDV